MAYDSEKSELINENCQLRQELTAARDEAERLRGRVEAMRHAGDMLSNAVFNINQIKERLPEEWQSSLGGLVAKWDIARNQASELEAGGGDASM